MNKAYSMTWHLLCAIHRAEERAERQGATDAEIWQAGRKAREEFLHSPQCKWLMQEKALRKAEKAIALLGGEGG